MRALIQRCSSASVLVENTIVGSIGKGLLVLVGICREDTEEDGRWITDKVLNIKVFENETLKPWTGSVKSLDLEILVVSQFTLHACTKKPKPDFHHSMGPDPAKALFDTVVENLRQQHKSEKIAQGVFGAMMDVSIVNSGPVTMWLDSHNRQDALWQTSPGAIVGEEAGGSVSPTTTPTTTPPTKSDNNKNKTKNLKTTTATNKTNNKDNKASLGGEIIHGAEAEAEAAKTMGNIGAGEESQRQQ